MNNITASESAILANLLDTAQQAIDASDRGEARACIAQALLMVQPATDTASAAEEGLESAGLSPHLIDKCSQSPSIYGRIQELRVELFGAMAMVAVTRDSIDRDDDYDRNRLLDDTYNRLNDLGTALDEIACDAKAPGGAL